MQIEAKEIPWLLWWTITHLRQCFGGPHFVGRIRSIDGGKAAKG